MGRTHSGSTLSPPRPEELGRKKDYRFAPQHAWTEEDGGYRDGVYYGSADGNGCHPADEGATQKTDSRICAECGTQRVFRGIDGKVDHLIGTTTTCNICSGRGFRE